MKGHPIIAGVVAFVSLGAVGAVVLTMYPGARRGATGANVDSVEQAESDDRRRTTAFAVAGAAQVIGTIGAIVWAMK